MKVVITDGIYTTEVKRDHWQAGDLRTDHALGIKIRNKGGNHITMILSSVEMAGYTLVRVNNLFGHPPFELAVLKAAANGSTKKLEHVTPWIVPPGFIKDTI